jgi:hypothetical protein
VKAPPRDSTQTASIFKTRSFQFLIDVVGAENIAIALDVASSTPEWNMFASLLNCDA